MKNKLLKTIFIFLIFSLGNLTFAENFGFFYETEKEFSLEGTLTYIGSDKVTRFKKAIDLKCNRLDKTCEILYANYIDNGTTLESTLFPSKKNCELITNQQNKKIIFCSADFIYKIYTKEKKLIIEKDEPLYELKWL